MVVYSPLLGKHGLPLVKTVAGNFHLSAFPKLVVKYSDWCWPRRGNAIDLLVQVLSCSSHEYMRELTRS
jgi:hypothetical protein